MSWVLHRPPALPGTLDASAAAAVVISVSKLGAIVQRVYLTVRPDRLPELTWWRANQSVDVLVGEGDDAGRIRVVDGGVFRISPPVKRKSGVSNAPLLQIRGLAGMPPDGLVRRPALWEVSGDVLIVTLPWNASAPASRPKSDAAASAAPSRETATPARPVAPASSPPASPPARARSQPSKDQRLVLTKLHQAGGVISKFSGLTFSDGRVLRDCEKAGWAEWTAANERWALTSAGRSLFADAVQAA